LGELVGSLHLTGIINFPAEIIETRKQAPAFIESIKGKAVTDFKIGDTKGAIGRRIRKGLEWRMPGPEVGRVNTRETPGDHDIGGEVRIEALLLFRDN
jgi:hypothetical protein